MAFISLLLCRGKGAAGGATLLLLGNSCATAVKPTVRNGRDLATCDFPHPLEVQFGADEELDGGHVVAPNPPCLEDGVDADAHR